MVHETDLACFALAFLVSVLEDRRKLGNVNNNGDNNNNHNNDCATLFFCFALLCFALFCSSLLFLFLVVLFLSSSMSTD